MRPMPPDALDEALALLGDSDARPELEAAAETFRAAERIRTYGPVRAARLQAIARAARLLADAAADGALPGETLEATSLLAIARAAHRDHDRLEAALAAPPARWQLLTNLASVWTRRGHRLGNGDGGRFHRFAQAVGDLAGCEISHHSVRKVCAKLAEKERPSHTAARADAA